MSWRAGTEAVSPVLAPHRDGMSVGGVVEHAQATVRKVAEMRVHHPRSTQQKFVTVTAGLATVLPQREEESAARLVDRAGNALSEAKQNMPWRPESGAGLGQKPGQEDLAIVRATRCCESPAR